MATRGSKLLLFVFFTLLLSSQAMAFDIFSPESPPGVAAGATCLINGPCSMESDIYMNGYTIHNVSIANLVVTYDWTGINNIPPGFADDIDNDTQYTADEVYIHLVAEQFILNEGKLNNTIETLVESGDVDLNWNYLINVPANLDVDRTDDVITTTPFGGDVSGTYDNINIGSNTIDESELDLTQVTLADFTNDVGYITNVSWGDILSVPAGFADNIDNDTQYENVSEFVNDAGYLTNGSLDVLLNDTSVDAYVSDLWVNETGDTMSGDLSMGNNSIMDVWELNVHNITGNSPVYVDDELRVQDRVVATGDIVLENPNTTAFVGERFEGASFTFVNPGTGETLMQVSETAHPIFGDDFGDITARTMTIDRLIITGLLNYSNTEPPDYYFSDEEWIYKTNTNGTSFTFNFNGTLLDSAIAEDINNATINWSQIELPPDVDLNASDDVLLSTLFGGDVNGTYDNLQLLADVIGDSEINYSEITVGDFFNDAQYINFYIFNDTVTALNQSIIDLAVQHNLDMVATNNTINNLNTSLTTYIMNVDNATNVRIDNLNLTFSQDISDLYTYIDALNTSLQVDHTNLWNAISALNLSHVNDVNDIYNTITNLNISLSQDITDVSNDLHNNYYNQTTSDDRYVNVAGDTMTGSLVINGNLTIIGDYVNATVETQYLDGDLIPTLDSMFDVGTSTAYWDTVYADNLIGLLSWTNLTDIPADLDLAASDDVLLTTNHGGDVSGVYSNLQLGAGVVGDNEINYGDVTVSDFTNDANYVNQTELGTAISNLNTSLSNDITNLESQHGVDISSLNASINVNNALILSINTSLSQDITDLENQHNTDVNTLNTSINNLQTYVDTQNHTGDVVGPYNDLQLQTDVVGDNELNYSDVTLADLTNDDGYVKDGDGNYIYKDTPLSDVVRFNETKLNETVYLLTGIFEETINITVVGGVGTGVTSDCCTGPVEILDVRVTPTSLGTKYKFSANSTITGEFVDNNLAQHTGVWWVAHRGSVVTDENINYFITNSDTDEVFSVRVRYRR